jgi:hypothetical protein
MIHDTRRFVITDVETVAELADLLTEYISTRCTGFRLDELLFLNDSFSEDGAQEYAVARDGRQVESVTFSWQSRAEAHHTIASLLSGDGLDLGPLEAIIDDPETHHCPLCA